MYPRPLSCDFALTNRNQILKTHRLFSNFLRKTDISACDREAYSFGSLRLIDPTTPRGGMAYGLASSPRSDQDRDRPLGDCKLHVRIPRLTIRLWHTISCGVAGKRGEAPVRLCRAVPLSPQGPQPQPGTHGCTGLASLAGRSATLPGTAGRAEGVRQNRTVPGRDTRVSRGKNSTEEMSVATQSRTPGVTVRLAPHIPADPRTPARSPRACMRTSRRS